MCDERVCGVVGWVCMVGWVGVVGWVCMVGYLGSLA